MFPGDFLVCVVTSDDSEESSESLIYRSIAYGYDSEEKAMEDLKKLKQEPEYSDQTLVVIRHIDETE